MAKDMFDISDDAWGMPQEAVKEFTDREDPQEAFERKFRVLSENWKKSFYVLCYYGIGGIGKTSFVNKLCKMIRGVEGNKLRLLDKIDCDYIRYDYDAKTSGTDKLSILLSLRKQLEEADKTFKFFQFDSAVLLYAKRSGNNIEKDETAKSLLERNPWLDVLSTLGTILGVGWVSDAIQAINSAKTVKDSFDKYMDEARYRSHLNEITSLEISELLKKLHEYFIMDMRYNMQQIATKPIIIFLDTYEKYIDTLNREISMITEDHWLRKGKNSVIRSIPGILWVITGQDKLYWAEDDAWDEPETERPLSQMSEEEKEELAEKHLEQHLLEDLIHKDATVFLKKAGIVNDTLCTQLYKLTNGTPLFLDMCVDTYHDLCSRGIPTEPEQFGEDFTQLISRYLSNMNDSNREMAYFLACLGKWNDESVQRIAKEATTLRWYTHAKYENFVKHSFIIKNLDGSYYMHATVRSAALKNADKEILEEIGRIQLTVAKEKVEAETTLDFNVALTEFTEILSGNNYSYEVFYESLKTVTKKYMSLEQAGSYDVLFTSSKKLFHAALKRYPTTSLEYIARSEYGQALCLKGFLKEALAVVSEIPLDGNVSDIEEEDWISVKAIVSGIYSANGMYHESLEQNKQVLEGRKRVLGVEHPDTLAAMNSLAVSHSNIGENQKALELEEQTLELMKRILGVDHPNTLTSMNNLAFIYGTMGKNQKALELKEQTLELMKQTFGEEHPITLAAMNSLAITYSAMGKNQKALELKEQTLELRKRVLGVEHPDTLTSMNNLAITYSAMGKNQKAFALYEQTFELRKRTLGVDHPDTLTSMNSLAVHYYNIGENLKALELGKQTVELRKQILGVDHLETLKSMNSLAVYYYNIGENQKALELEEQTLELTKRILGVDHPETLKSMNNLAIIYGAMGKNQKALELKEQTLELMKQILGIEHPDTLTSMSNLAISYSAMGKNQKALELEGQTLKLKKRILGIEHPDTLTSMNNLAVYYYNMGENQKALELMKRMSGDDYLDT